MGGGSSSQSSRTQTTTNTQYTTDQSYNDNSTNNVSIVDGGAVDAMKEVSVLSLGANTELTKAIMGDVKDISTGAMAFVADSYRTDSAQTQQTFEKVVKYTAVAAAVVGASYAVLKVRK